MEIPNSIFKAMPRTPADRRLTARTSGRGRASSCKKTRLKSGFRAWGSEVSGSEAGLPLAGKKEVLSRDGEEDKNMEAATLCSKKKGPGEPNTNTPY